MDHSGYASAKDHYEAAKNAGQIHGDNNPPPGALVYWDTGQYGHIALSVDDMQGELDDLAAKGIEPEKPPYASRPGGSTICFIRDPDGYRIELVEMPSVCGLSTAQTTISAAPGTMATP